LKSEGKEIVRKEIVRKEIDDDGGKK